MDYHLRLAYTLQPLIYIAIALYGAILVLYDICRGETSILDLVNGKLQSRIFGRTWLIVRNLTYEKEKQTCLPDLVASARGTVVEVGPGSGNQLGRYTASAITHIYGIEPNVSLHAELRVAIRLAGLQGKYTILPCAIEDAEGLKTFGLGPASVDTVVLVQVLCSVARPKDTVAALYALLKPGGVFVFYEHVRAVDAWARRVQDTYDVVWPLLMGGCRLTRCAEEYILAAGRWADVQIQSVKSEPTYLVLPHASGRLVKA